MTWIADVTSLPVYEGEVPGFEKHQAAHEEEKEKGKTKCRP